jgi:hypothetical protein
MADASRNMFGDEVMVREQMKLEMWRAALAELSRAWQFEKLLDHCGTTVAHQ